MQPTRCIDCPRNSTQPAVLWCPGRSCPGRSKTVWGGGDTDANGNPIFTGDSSPCACAAFAELLNSNATAPDQPQCFTLTPCPGRDKYQGGENNGVTARSYGPWRTSFTIGPAPPGVQPPPGMMMPMQQQQQQVNTSMGIDIPVPNSNYSAATAAFPPSCREYRTDSCSGVFFCPGPNCPGRTRAVYGGGREGHTGDSSVCAAAVYAGIVPAAGPGVFALQPAPGQKTYPGGTQNGITCRAWSSGYPCSFYVVPAPSGVSVPPNVLADAMAPKSCRDRAQNCCTGVYYCTGRDCPGRARTVWGKGPHSGDSSICACAQYAGLAGDGPSVFALQAAPGLEAGQSSYEAGTHNGITCRSWSRGHPCSFYVVPAPAGVLPPPPPSQQVHIVGDPSRFANTRQQPCTSHRRNEVGSFYCPGKNCPGRRRTVWGGGGTREPYTNDSSICAAAQHALGGNDGPIAFILTPAEGLQNYTGSSKHGITSRSYGKWPGSFHVHPATLQPHALRACQTSLNNATNRDEESDDDDDDDDNNDEQHSSSYHPCDRFVGDALYECPGPRRCRARRANQTVWGGGGSSLYSDDSALCLCAVHAGVVPPTLGGRFRVKHLPGLNHYEGSTQNGVTSRSYGRWAGSVEILPEHSDSIESKNAGVAMISDSDNRNDNNNNNNNNNNNSSALHWIRCASFAPPPEADFNLSDFSMPIRVVCHADNSCRLNHHHYDDSNANNIRPRLFLAGTGMYSMDSDICLAARHAGVLGARGGEFVVQILPGLEQYTGSSSYGVTSEDRGRCFASFVVKPFRNDP